MTTRNLIERVAYIADTLPKSKQAETFAALRAVIDHLDLAGDRMAVIRPLRY